MNAKKFSAALAAATLYLYSLGAANSLTIIRKDTVWLSGEQYTGHYQIAPEATLTIQPGATVAGGTIEVGGRLIAGSNNGQRVLFRNTYIGFVSTATQSAQILIEDAAIIGGRLLGNYSERGRVVVKNTFINNNHYSALLAHVTAPDSIFEGNLFYRNSPLSIQALYPIKIRNNTFVDSLSDAIAVGTAYGSLVIEFNNFLGKGVALRYTSTGGSVYKINAKNNWFDTQLRGKVNRRVIDGNDNLSISGIFDVRPFLLEPSADAPFSGTTEADKYRGNAKNNMAHASSGNDTLIGGQRHDVLLGGDGDDSLLGGPGSDVLSGGAGRDRFVYRDVSESTPLEPDLITDFEPSSDKIVLSTVDANSDAAGRQGFVFIGSENFSGNPGELRFEKRYDIGWVRTIIYGNTNVDPEPEFMIVLDGDVELGAHSFKL